MSRDSRLSFIRADYNEPVRRRVMLDMNIERCQLTKLYAYNGLMLSSGVRIDGINIHKPSRVIVVAIWIPVFISRSVRHPSTGWSV